VEGGTRRRERVPRTGVSLIQSQVPYR